MDEAIENAVEELKRVDHSIFVSLKYTRTVDVLVNILIRMVDCYEFLFLAVLRYAHKQKIITDIPGTPKERCTLIKKIFKEREMHDNIDLYFLLKAMQRSVHTKENEYRRHVAMRAIVAGREEIININIISRYYEFLTSFFHLVDNLRKGQYEIGSGVLITQDQEHGTDEENPNNPHWIEVRRMKEEAEMEIARDKEIRERIRLEKQNKEAERLKDLKKRMEREKKALKKKRITKRKPKIQAKKVIPNDKLRMMELRKKEKMNEQKKKKTSKKK